jgi:hypothetical protein
MKKLPKLNRHERAMLERRQYQSIVEINAANKWLPIMVLTLCFASINVFVMWVLINYGEGWAILSLLGSMFFMGVISHLDVVGLLNSRRLRSNMNGNLAAYVSLWLFLLLFPAIANSKEIPIEICRRTALCLASIPTIGGFFVR